MLQERSLVKLTRMSSRLEIESKRGVMKEELSLAVSKCGLASELTDH